MTTLALVASIGGWAPPAPVAQRVAAEVAARWHAPVERVRLAWDAPRDSLPIADDASLTISGSGSGGVFSVAVRAPGAKRAVLLRVRAGVEREAPVATHALAHGAIVAAGDVAVAPVLTWGAPSGEEPSPVGWITRRAVAAGEPLRAPTVALPDVVTSGAPVTVRYRDDAIELRLTGVALNSGALGEHVTVRLGSGRRLDGVAAGASLVSIPPQDRASTVRSTGTPR